MLGRLDREAQTLALAILNKNAIELSDSERSHLVQGLADWRELMLATDDSVIPAFTDELAFASLLTILDSGNAERPREAAKKLLDHNASQLPMNIRAKCDALTTTANAWGWPTLESNIKRLREDPAYAAAIALASAEIVQQGGDRPLLDTIRSAVTGDTGGWDDVVWKLICEPQWSSLDS